MAEPLYTVNDEAGRLHIVRIIRTSVVSPNTRPANVDVADISTGNVMTGVPLNRLEPFVSPTLIDPTNH